MSEDDRKKSQKRRPEEKREGKEAERMNDKRGDLEITVIVSSWQLHLGRR